jgi:hypothetical protein
VSNRGRWGWRAAVVVAVLGATLAHLRVARDVRAFSPHDEQLYLDEAVALARDGATALRARTTEFLATPRRWLYPPPTRWGHHLAAAAAVAAWGEEFRSLVRLSTLAAVAAVVLAALLARRLGGDRAAVVAAALLGSSPLWLHLGRRALADAPQAAIGLAATWAFLEASRPGARRWTAGVAALLLAWHVASKETGVVLLAVLAVVHALAAAREGEAPRGAPFGALLAGGLLAWLGFTLLAGSPWAYARVMDAVRVGGAKNEYVAAYQVGPWYAAFRDLALLAPGVMLLAPAAVVWGLRRRRARLVWGHAAVAALYVPALVVVGMLSGMGSNARFLLLGDALLRVVVAVAVARWATTPTRVGVVAGGVLVNTALEGWLFRRVFLERGVYDPVSDALLRALELRGS